MKAINGWFSTSFVIRVSGDAPVAAEAARALHDADPEVPVGKFAEMQSFVDETVAAPRFFAWMSGGFAGFALLLTAVGLFGLLSYQVGMRTREIGVRMAVGAGRGQILLMVRAAGDRADHDRLGLSGWPGAWCCDASLWVCLQTRFAVITEI